MAEVPPFSELIAAMTVSAVHLEMRDAYTPHDVGFLDWQAGNPVPVPALPEWHDLVRANVTRGIRFRRARIVSEPVAPFIRYEYDITDGSNVAAGEEVRWLPRRGASDLFLPLTISGCSMTGWCGSAISPEPGSSSKTSWSEDPSVVKLCWAAFETVWERAIPHAQYRPA